MEHYCEGAPARLLNIRAISVLWPTPSDGTVTAEPSSQVTLADILTRTGPETDASVQNSLFYVMTVTLPCTFFRQRKGTQAQGMLPSSGFHQLSHIAIISSFNLETKPSSTLEPANPRQKTPRNRYECPKGSATTIRHFGLAVISNERTLRWRLARCHCLPKTSADRTYSTGRNSPYSTPSFFHSLTVCGTISNGSPILMLWIAE